MNKIKIFCSWDLDIDLYHEKQIELYVDVFPNSQIPENTIRYVVLIEPEEILNLTHQAMYHMKKGTYNFLLTHNQFLLDNCQNAHLFEFGTCWIKNFIFKEKENAITTLVGGKRMAEGHIIRQDIWNRQDEIKSIPTQFFLSGNFGNIPNPKNNPILGSEKNPLFNAKYHICIENTKKQNWFTEKLIDCFQTKTVPIYYGCPNISDWFDVRGMILVNSSNDIIDKCNSIEENFYEKNIEYIEKNYELSKKFINIGDRLKEKINNITNEL